VREIEEHYDGFLNNNIFFKLFKSTLCLTIIGSFNTTFYLKIIIVIIRYKNNLIGVLLYNQKPQNTVVI
jgi:hypothetical protein